MKSGEFLNGIPFHESQWLERARRRHGVPVVPHPLEEAQLAELVKYSEDVRHIRNIGRIVEWCRKKGLKVLFLQKGGGEYFSEERIITSCKTTTPQHQLHIILHEIGHFLIGHPKRHQRFGMGYHDEEACIRNTVHNRLDILEEEFEAWHLGWELGRKLRVLRQSDRMAFDRNRTRLLKQYVNWAAKSWKRSSRPSVRRSGP